ncbi:MAG: histidine phosphatase family protein [Ilumatobacteraceae bacterium]|nr:histidine phosphatase family protein [Ilumatobacteraceae bacterium]
MELLIIRHALPVRRELTEGIADPELAPEGLLQAEHLAKYLATEKIDAVYASPLRRAQQTAAPLAALQKVAVTLIDDVAEWDRNSNEYVPVEELKATNDPRWQAMLRGEWNVPEESADEFNKRTIGAVDKLIDLHSGHRIAIVCHGGVINAYLTYILGLSNYQQGFFYPNYTSIHRVAAARSGERSIVTINETSHLRGTGLPMGLFQKG